MAGTEKEHPLSPIGTTLQRFLEEEGIADEVEEIARKRVSDWCRQQTTVDVEPRPIPSVDAV